MKEDYLQAYVILEDCPRMSAVLSRRILSDLLKKYDGANHFGTKNRIDYFRNNPKHPSRLRENLHYLREIADLGHTHKSTQQHLNQSWAMIPTRRTPMCAGKTL